MTTTDDTSSNFDDHWIVAKKVKASEENDIQPIYHSTCFVIPRKVFHNFEVMESFNVTTYQEAKKDPKTRRVLNLNVKRIKVSAAYKKVNSLVINVSRFTEDKVLCQQVKYCSALSISFYSPENLDYLAFTYTKTTKVLSNYAHFIKSVSFELDEWSGITGFDYAYITSFIELFRRLRIFLKSASFTISSTYHSKKAVYIDKLISHCRYVEYLRLEFPFIQLESPDELQVFTKYKFPCLCELVAKSKRIMETTAFANMLRPLLSFSIARSLDKIRIFVYHSKLNKYNEQRITLLRASKGLCGNVWELIIADTKGADIELDTSVRTTKELLGNKLLERLQLC
jgi:hypothetical protein